MRNDILAHFRADASHPKPITNRWQLDDALRAIRTKLPRLQEGNGQFHLDAPGFLIHLGYRDRPEEGITFLDALVAEPPLPTALVSFNFAPSAHEPEFVDLVDVPPSGGQSLPSPRR